MGFIDFIVQFSRVLASSINERTTALQVDLSGVGSVFEDDNPEDGETSVQSAMYGALGFLSRPLNPEMKAGKEYACEAVCIRTEDGLVPISWRDLRLNALFPSGIPEGRVGMVGYGGGFHTIDLTTDLNGDQKSSIHFIYAPYDYSNGVAGKAMAVALDTTPGAEHISLSIGSPTSGFQVSINETDGVQVRTPNSSTMFNIRDDEINMAANKIVLKGNVYLGAAAEAGLPLLAGAASPPSTTVFVSP